jgi:hypothetical protein
MMAIQRLTHPPSHVQDSVGSRRDVLIWGYGVTTGHVVAVQVLDSGAADLVVEFDAPVAVVVPDSVCPRVGNCRFDTKCPSFVACARHGVDDEQELA